MTHAVMIMEAHLKAPARNAGIQFNNDAQAGCYTWYQERQFPSCYDEFLEDYEEQQ